MSREGHCRTDDDPPIDDMCRCVYKPHAGRTEADNKAFREEVEIEVGRSRAATVRRCCALRAISMRTSWG